MENNELFQTLEKLKDTLSDVASARQQVENVVSAYTNINTEINSYVENFKQIEVSIAALIDLLKNNRMALEKQAISVVCEFRRSCTSIADDIKRELTASSQQLDAGVSQNLSRMTKHIEKLGITVDEAHKLIPIVQSISASTSNIVDNINAIKQDLNTSQKKQDEAIEHIGNTQNSVLQQAKSCNTFLDAIDKSFSKQEKLLVSQKQNLEIHANSTRLDLDALSTGVTQLEALCNDIKSSISHTQQAIDSLTKVLESSSARIFKENKINRWLLIIGLIILIIIHFV